MAKNLKVYKVQLLNLILKSLTSYHSKNNPKSQIRSGLEEVDVLIDKQLYTYASDHLARTSPRETLAASTLAVRHQPKPRSEQNQRADSPVGPILLRPW